MVVKNTKFKRMITPGEWEGSDMGQGRDIGRTSTLFAKYACIFVRLFCIPFYVQHNKRSRNTQIFPSHPPSLPPFLCLPSTPTHISLASVFPGCVACTGWTMQTWFLPLGAYSLVLQTFYEEVKEIVWHVLIVLLWKNQTRYLTEINRGADA